MRFCASSVQMFTVFNIEYRPPSPQAGEGAGGEGDPSLLSQLWKPAQAERLGSFARRPGCVIPVEPRLAFIHVHWR